MGFLKGFTLLKPNRPVMEQPELYNFGTIRKKTKKSNAPPDQPLNLQLFANNYDIMDNASLERSIRKHKKKIETHQRKIEHPEEYVDDWGTAHEKRKAGIIQDWEKQIRNFRNQLHDDMEELERRRKK